MHRFCYICPEPADYMSDDLDNAPQSTVTTVSILHFIQAMHKIYRLYTFTPEAWSFAKKIHDECKRFTFQANTCDGFLG